MKNIFLLLCLNFLVANVQPQVINCAECDLELIGCQANCLMNLETINTCRKDCRQEFDQCINGC